MNNPLSPPGERARVRGAKESLDRKLVWIKKEKPRCSPPGLFLMIILNIPLF
jgi:hypothetical protein